ncbi:MAG: hypothetical protein IT237_05215 [Bacteroidia bacterium]|nr:hypothetical protein [Bacteroidia bacterium]
MRTLIISAICLSTIKGFAINPDAELLSTPTYTTITKSNGGLFGYKYVDATITSNGNGGFNAILACSDPGMTSCKWKNAQAFETELSNDELNEVEILVFEKIQNSRDEIQKGNFIYNNNFLVLYDYNLEENKLEYKILNREEAKEYGFNI